MTDSNKTWLPRTKRFPVQIPISVSTIGTFLDSEIMNLSKGGIFIRADITLPLGTEVDLKFSIPYSDRAVEATGTVVWTRKAGPKPKGAFPDHPAGMGIQFKQIDLSDMEFLLDSIERIMENS
ncbi:MAG TPA: TIGR02266 family protein [Bdellovibrionota bacterium]|nr:TIGR02266 family protein [Bdellovibrionota bacterium]